MANYRVLIGSLAFGISFGIGLITSQNVGKALATGLTTVPATLLAVSVADRRQFHQAESRIATLKHHIYALQQRRAEAYRDYAALTAENEQLLLAYNSAPIHALPAQTQAVARSQKKLSWDLSTSAATHQPIPAYNLPTEIREPEPVSDVQHLDKTVLQPKRTPWMPTQLSQDQATPSGPTANLEQEIANLTEQKQRLEAESRSLQTEVTDLERCRVELEQFLSYAETKKRELETGSNPVQIALKQLESQMATLQTELTEVESAVVLRRSENQALEQAIAKQKHERDALTKAVQQRRSEKDSLEKMVNRYRAEKESLEKTLTQRRTEYSQIEARLAKVNQSTPQTVETEIKPSKEIDRRNGLANQSTPQTVEPEPKPSKETDRRNGFASVLSKPTQSTEPDAPSVPQPVKSLERPTPPPLKTPTPSDVASPGEAASSNGSSSLPEEWEEFMMQLPEYEFQVLKAIAEQHNPAPIIKKISEDNLTMPEVLLESINERALDLIGDLVIEPGATINSTTIAREHSKIVRKLIKTYEYLAE
jgi:myosin heavy subunit